MPKAASDLTGCRFGRLTAVKRSDRKNRQGKRLFWICQCDCGNFTESNISDLRRGHTKSCGCYQKEIVSDVVKMRAVRSPERIPISKHPKNNKHNLTDMRFGRLLVVSEAGRSKDKHVTWNCKCVCGNSLVVSSNQLLRGGTTSCGCYQLETATKHGLRQSRLYKIWCNMKSRCNNPNVKCYHHYGGRGISIYSDWSEDFREFAKWAEISGYSDVLELDRIDVNRGYSPGNCRWVNSAQQADNRRNTRYVTLDGETHTLKEWSDMLKINYTTLYSRLRRGLSFIDGGRA